MPNPIESPRIDPAAYAEFIRQIELEDIWLKAASIENLHGPSLPEPGPVKIVEGESSWEPTPRGFYAYRNYKLKLSDERGREVANFDVTFGAEYKSDQPMTDDIFGVFSDINLPINLWPFFREFIYSAVGRMGWFPITLPAVKVGTPRLPSQPEQEPKVATPEPTKRPRKRSSPAKPSESTAKKPRNP